MMALIRIVLFAMALLSGQVISDTFYGGVVTTLVITFIVYDVTFRGERK